MGKFGNAKYIQGNMVSAKSTLVPMGILKQVKERPIPITITSTTFTISATSANPVEFWIGEDFFKIEEDLTYTWSAGALNTILASTGLATTLQSPALGVWYFYVGITDTTGAVLLYPSQTAPSDNSLNHPGTSKVRDYRYVGFCVCTATTTPAIMSMTKFGYRYNFAANTIATTSGYAVLNYTGATALPALGALGQMIGGYFNVGAGGTVIIGSTSSATLGIIKASAVSVSADAFFPLPPMTPSSAGKIYAIHTVGAGDVSITFVDDIV